MKKYEKTQEKLKVLEKNLEKPKALRKNPRTQDWIKKTQDLGRKPKEWQRWSPCQMLIEVKGLQLETQSTGQNLLNGFSIHNNLL